MKTAFVALITLFMLHTVSEAADNATPLPALLQQAGKGDAKAQLAGAQASVGFAYLRDALSKDVLSRPAFVISPP